MFGDSVSVNSESSDFNLVCSYNVNIEYSRKNARYMCGGPTCADQVQVLDHTYTNFMEHTSSRLFYSVSVVENFVIHCLDVINGFGETPPPKQGFYIHPDKDFHECWTTSLNRPPLPKCTVIPVQRVIQGQRKIHSFERNISITSSTISD